MKHIKFSEQEEQALLVLIDAGVKAGGLQLCTAAAVWQQKIQNAEESSADDSVVDTDKLREPVSG